MQTAPAPVAPPTRKSRKRWYIAGGILLFLVATPVGFYFVASSLNENELQAACREADADDPHWLWDDLLAQRKLPPDERNSAVQVLKVRGLLSAKPFNVGPKWDNQEEERVARFRNAELTEEQVMLLRIAFANLDATTLLEARKLKDMPDGGYSIESAENPATMIFSYLQDTRTVVRLLNCDAMMRAQERDFDGAAESCQALLNAGRAIGDHSTLIGQLVRMACDSVGANAIERTLGQGEVSEKNLQELQAMLEKEVDEKLLYHGIHGERAIGHQTYILLRAGKASFSQVTGAMRPGAGEHVADALPFLILRGYPEHLRMYNEQVRAAKLPDGERMAAFQKVEDKLRKNAAAGVTGNLLMRLTMPAIMRVAEADQRRRTNLGAAVVAVAAERFRLKHERWPAMAEELVKEGLLKDIPRDPFDGKPLRWRRTKTGLIVYSVGPDQVDNGGKFDRSNWRTPGTDIGFELWDFDRRSAPPPAPEEMPAEKQ